MKKIILILVLLLSVCGFSQTTQPIKFPTLIGQSGKFLSNNGSKYTWAPVTTEGKIGTLFSDLFTTSVNYEATLITGTQTFLTNHVEIAGNGNNFTNNFLIYKYNGFGTLMSNYSIKTTFVSTFDSPNPYGFAVGLHQGTGNNSFVAAVSTSSGTTRGTVYILDPVTGTVNTTSATKLVYSNSTDNIQVDVQFLSTKILVNVSNLTTKTRIESTVSVPNTVTLEYNFTPSLAASISRQGRPVIYNLGGTQKVYSLSLSSQNFNNPRLVYIGDSKLIGTGATTIENAYINALLYNNKNDRSYIWAKGGLPLSNVNTSFAELATIIKEEKAFVVIILGINDAINGRTLAQFQADYLAFIQSIQNINCIPIVTKIAYVRSTYTNATAINNLITSYNTWIGTLGLKILDENTGTTLTGALDPALTTDGVHYNDYGHLIVANLLKSQMEAYVGQLDVAPIVGSNTQGTFLQSNGTARPKFGAVVFPTSQPINQIMYSTAVNVIGGNSNFTYNGTSLDVLKSQNAVTDAVIAQNLTVGTNSQVRILVGSGSQYGAFASYSSGYASFKQSEAGKISLHSNSGNGLNIATINAAPLQFWTNDFLRGQFLSTGEFSLNHTLRLKSYTVATLPAGVVGDVAYVTDASAPTYNATVVGGGTVVTLVFFNGAAWTTH